MDAGSVDPHALPEGFQLTDQTQADPHALPPGFKLQGEAAPEPHKFGLMDTWPARLAKTIYSAVTLPGDVYAGRVDPLSPEAIGRSTEAAALFNPAEPGIAAGRGAFGAIKTVRPVELPANVQAAKTSVDLGAGLPMGVASPNPIVRGLTQGARQLPLVGPKITEGVNQTIEAAGERVGDLSSELSQGVQGRAATGAILRPALRDVIDKNNATIGEHYNDLRGMIDPSKEFELLNTQAALNDVLGKRYAAKKVNPTAGLEDVRNLASGPVSFDGLQRARSDFGQKTNFGENVGYTEGERKQLYGAMSSDMENIARQSGGENAVNALRQANSRAAQLIEQNKTLSRLTGMRSEEGITGTLIHAANAKTGNIGLLSKLRGSMDPEDFQQISGAALAELGHNPATGQFSLAKFQTGWDSMGNEAKNVLFDPNHKKLLDEIAGLGKFIKGGEQYRNTSNTGHAVGIFAILEHLGDAFGHAIKGNYGSLLGTAAGAAGGFTVGKILARPATASSVARWTRAAQAYDRAPSIRNRVGVNLATRNLINNLSDLVPRDRLIQALSPQAAEANSNNPPAPGGSTPQRLQVRIPAQ